MDAGYRLLAAKYIRKQNKLLSAQFDGIRAGEDIEFVHRARVASRRLRASLRFFDDCFKPKQIKRWKKAIRRIRAELGAARDKDVQIELLRGVLASLTDQACYSGISRLMVEWEYQREDLQRDVVKAVDRLQRNGALGAMNRAAKRILREARSREAQVQCPLNYTRARQEILRRLDELVALQECLDRPDDQQAHHAMRIAAKRLRYTMEIARPIYSGRLDDVLEGIKQVQTILGEVHDCDVWQEQLDQFAKIQRRRIHSRFGQAGPFTRLNAGIEYLRQDRHRRRQQCFEDLVQLWRKFDAEGLWENLAGIIESSDMTPARSATSRKEQKEAQSPDTIIEAAAPREPTLAGQGGNGNQDRSPALLSPSAADAGKKHVLSPHRPSRPSSVSP
jgi:CHAD domain-containing protein